MILTLVAIILITLLALAEIIVLAAPIQKTRAMPNPDQMVSILMVVRNEEGMITDCIDSILAQEYSHFELLISDDHSTDSTPQRIRNYQGDKRLRSFFSKVKVVEGLNAKALNLAFLMDQAKGKVIAVVDGDCVYPPSWLRRLLDAKPDVGIVSGVTGIIDSYWEHMDWLTAIGRVAVLNKLGFRTTAIGNNMLFDRKAYESTSGWKEIAASITEDHELNRQILKAGYQSTIVVDKDVLAMSEKAGFMGLLRQRSRWMKGAWQLPLPIVLVLIVQLFAFPVMAYLIVVSFGPLDFWRAIGSWVVVLYLSVKITSDYRILSHLGFGFSWKLIIYQIYSLIISFSMFVMSLFLTKVEWKGRKYS